MNMPAMVIEILALLAVLGAAAAMARPFRHSPDAGHEARFPLRSFWAPLVMPLTVIGLSAVLFRLASQAACCQAQMPSLERHARAWMVFWTAVLAVNLVESVAGFVWALRGKAFPVPELLRNILRALLYVAAAFLVLNRILGRDISTLLTSTALLTAVVGFALQGVLGNLLAGMSLHLARSVFPSDWIAVDGVEG